MYIEGKGFYKLSVLVSFCLHEASSRSTVNLSSVKRNYQLLLLTLVTATENCYFNTSSPSKMSNIASKSSPHTNRSSALSAILNEHVHGQSHVTGLFNIGTALLFIPLKFAEFHNQSPLLTMERGNFFQLFLDFERV